MIGPSINHNATACPCTHLINPSLEPYNGKAPVTADCASKQSTRCRQDPRLAASLQTPPIEQERSMIQPSMATGCFDYFCIL